MSFIDRIAHRFGFRRMRRRSAGPSQTFQMANVNRLTASWTTTSTSADSQARAGLAISRARSRQLRDDNDYASKFVSMLKTNVLGEGGIHFKSGVRDPDRVVANKLVTGPPDVFANKIITDAWWRWGKKEFCTVSGTMTWCDVQRVVLECVAVDGEAIVRKIPTPTTENPYGFTLKIYEGSRLDVEHNEMSPDGNEIRMGVEQNKDGRPLYYWLLNQDPGENFFLANQRFERERVPAAQILHVGIIRRACQTRYNPLMVTSGYRMNMLGKYEEAEVTGARVAASKMGFITQENGPEGYVGEDDGDGNKIMDAEPGVFEVLRRGQNVTSLDWQHPSTAFGAFMKTALRGIAAGLNVSYNSLANDMESVNFASGKLGLMEEREVWKAMQTWFIESFCEPVFEAWLLNAITGGAINLPVSKFDKFNSPIFRGRRWQYVNPSQDVDADIRQINSGLTSISRILAERNIDRDELFDEIQSDKEALESRDIELPELTSKLEIAEATAAKQREKANPLSEDETAEERALQDFGITPKQFRKHVDMIKGAATDS